VSIYPKHIYQISRTAEFSGRCSDENAVGKAVSFICGSFVRFGLCVDGSEKRIEHVRYSTNGCGFAIAAAETIARKLRRLNLADLHGTKDITRLIDTSVGVFPKWREQCLETVIEAFRSALANYRLRLVEEFVGEKALICTCFAIPEETIVNLIAKHQIADLSELSMFSNAGSGCGSCQMLIRELIDAPRD
jgi:NifU-like protein